MERQPNKVVVLDEIYNFLVQFFFIWNGLGAQIFIAILYESKYKKDNIIRLVTNKFVMEL